MKKKPPPIPKPHAAPIVDVHVLLGGQALCGFDNRLPAEWPEGHLWCSLHDLKDATCIPCKQLARDPQFMSHYRVGDRTPFGTLHAEKTFVPVSSDAPTRKEQS